MSMFLDSSRTLPDTKEGLGNPDMSGILLDSPTLLLSWPAASRADAFGSDTVAHVLFPEAAAPASASPASRFALAVIGVDDGRRLKARTGRSERE